MSDTSLTGHIIAIGGAGFSLEEDNLLLWRYALALVDSPRPKVCYFGQANAESLDHTVHFYQTFTALGCLPTHCSLFAPPTADLRSFVLEQDLICVGGGNTKSMLALWREWGLDHIFREFWEQGKVLMGISAGSICWFEQGVTDSIPGDYTALTCLGFLPGSNCPHYDGEVRRRPDYHRLLQTDQIVGGYACDNGVALHYVGDQLDEIVSIRPSDAYAYHVTKSGDEVSETCLTPRYLGADQ
ncbi:MAG TPA: peptidase E [Ktedonobacterales bacterium]|nr:peptidase E [Ktedonobacterales bacterium]